MPTTGNTIITGSIGQGKSRLSEYTILKSFDLNQPCCYIDPKGDTYPAILANFFRTTKGKEIWEKYKHRIIFINPTSKSNYIVGFNAIQPVDGFPHAEVDKTAFVSNFMTTHITRSSGFDYSEANRMQGILTATLGLMVEGGHGKLTLAELPLIFKPYSPVGEKAWTYNPMVTQLLSEITHFGTKVFWKDMWTTWGPNDRRSWVQSTLGRIQPFLFDERVLLTTCTSENAALDFNEIVNKGYWVFVNLDFNILSESVTTFLGSLICAKLFNAAMLRDENRAPYRLIVDEARLLNTAPFERILETGRAYGMWLTLIVQDLNQLYRPTSNGKDFHLRDSALNTSERIYAFRNDLDSAQILAERMFPVTGTLQRGVRESGDVDYLPTDAERALYIRRFTTLQPRMMIIYDKNNPDTTQAHSTPDLDYPDSSQSEVNYFETQHMRIIGRPAESIRREIQARRAKWEALVEDGGQIYFRGSKPVPPVSVFDQDTL